MKMKKLTALLSAAAMMFGLTPLAMAESSVYEYNAATKTFEIHETVVPGDIKVKEAGADDSEYKDSVTVKFDSDNSRKFDFKATLDMTPVKEKFDAAVEVITLKGKYDDFKSREVDGQFTVTVIPGNYITIPNPDQTGTNMYGFTTSSDIYEETAARTIDKDGNLVITVDLKDGVTVEKLGEASSLVDIAYTSADVDVRKAGTVRIKGTVTGWIETVPTPGSVDEYNAKATFVAKENNDVINSKYVELAKALAEFDKRQAVQETEILCLKKDLEHKIELEAERRACGDNNLFSYVKSHYVQGTLRLTPSDICPPVMERYNSWEAPTTSTETTTP